MSDVKLKLNKMSEDEKKKIQEYMKWVFSTFRENPLSSNGNRYYAFDEDNIVTVKIQPAKGFVELTDIMVPPAMQKKGLGNKVMKMITDKADDIGVVLKLNAVSYSNGDSMDDTALEAWYKKFGFQDDDDAYGGYYYDMVRFPNGNTISESTDEPDYDWEYSLKFKKIRKEEEKKLGFTAEEFEKILDGSDMLSRESFFDFGSTNKYIKMPKNIKNEIMELEDVICGYNDDWLIHWVNDRKDNRFYVFKYVRG